MGANGEQAPDYPWTAGQESPQSKPSGYAQGICDSFIYKLREEVERGDYFFLTKCVLCGQ